MQGTSRRQEARQREHMRLVGGTGTGVGVALACICRELDWLRGCVSVPEHAGSAQLSWSMLEVLKWALAVLLSALKLFS